MSRMNRLNEAYKLIAYRLIVDGLMSLWVYHEVIRKTVSLK